MPVGDLREDLGREVAVMREPALTGIALVMKFYPATQRFILQCRIRKEKFQANAAGGMMSTQFYPYPQQEERNGMPVGHYFFREVDGKVMVVLGISGGHIKFIEVAPKKRKAVAVAAGGGVGGADDGAGEVKKFVPRPQRTEKFVKVIYDEATRELLRNISVGCVDVESMLCWERPFDEVISLPIVKPLEGLSSQLPDSRVVYCNLFDCIKEGRWISSEISSNRWSTPDDLRLVIISYVEEWKSKFQKPLQVTLRKVLEFLQVPLAGDDVDLTVIMFACAVVNQVFSL
jgi:hypothetical protein